MTEPSTPASGDPNAAPSRRGGGHRACGERRSRGLHPADRALPDRPATGSPGGCLGIPTRRPMPPRTRSCTPTTRSRKYRGGLFRSWLLRITANASYDILRRAQRKPTTTLPDAEEGEAELPTRSAADPEAEAGVPSSTATSTSPSAGCRRTSAPRSCCATSTGWTTPRWPTRHPRSGRSSHGSIADGSDCAS